MLLQINKNALLSDSQQTLFGDALLELYLYSNSELRVPSGLCAMRRIDENSLISGTLTRLTYPGGQAAEIPPILHIINVFASDDF